LSGKTKNRANVTTRLMVWAWGINSMEAT